MNRKNIFSVLILTITVCCIWFLLSPNVEETDFSERVKISLREAGNKLLLSQKDSTSLILPVVKVEEFKYQISFQNELSFLPNTLVTAVKNSLENTSFSDNYRVEVIECNLKEVAYSYEVNKNEEKTIIPCAGRMLPENCYLIEVKFINKTEKSIFKYTLLALSFLLLTFIITRFFFQKNKEKTINIVDVNAIDIGTFMFYPHQNKLVQKAAEINLSKKECELLEIFVANKNKIIKREELTKKVWEDNGVFVGRSLDTYISKLRKKLKDDTSIQLINIHGVGYKLEIKK